jgi:hypothetical protein
MENFQNRLRLPKRREERKMKKIGLLLVLLFVLCGCSPNPLGPTTNPQPPQLYTITAEIVGTAGQEIQFSYKVNDNFAIGTYGPGYAGGGKFIAKWSSLFTTAKNNSYHFKAMNTAVANGFTITIYRNGTAINSIYGDGIRKETVLEGIF